ncbi:phosphate starvation protein PhoH [Desulforamulus profundi]|uniref:PhoH-like protein n=1 Tax=Desulforamulus profundi TaxID=1383067 RepID=A0A2C6LGK7_9FIRM|nr:PhoH family protein [Desulforamulus profundi]MCL5779366.1 PhoH family protein [Bacillota bacterium]PHJ37250.1 phosphate starvation protein PhoH [Desulforamulus profundi]
MTERTEQKVVIGDLEAAAEIFGKQDENINLIEQSLGIRVVARGEELTLIGTPEQVEQGEEVFSQLFEYYKSGNHIGRHEINYVLRSVKSGVKQALTNLAKDVVLVTARGKQVKPKTLGQKDYIQNIRKNDIVFAIGPAGSGKTYLAVAMAVNALRKKEVNRLILTRPAVEAGEKLGFLPGDLQEKIDPYLRPLYDSLYDILGLDHTQKYLERNMIEIAPLAYMRGRTLEDAFIILDEAQNTTPEQMKMFLTRLGFGSKAVITGDITQIDLPKGTSSGLVDAKRVLEGVKGIAFQWMTGADIVRHPLVMEIIRAYEQQAEQ